MSANTGGPAFPGTLLDWYAWQALPAVVAHAMEFNLRMIEAGEPPPLEESHLAKQSYDYASAMLAEKARREAVGQQSSTTDHSEDWLEKVVKLEAANKELVEALESFKHADGCYCEAAFSMPNGTQPRHTPECENARAIIAKNKGAA